MRDCYLERDEKWLKWSSMGGIENSMAIDLKKLEEVVTQLYIEGIGVDINAQDPDKEKALAWACQRGYTTAARMLIKRGIYSSEALKEAAFGGHNSLIQLMIGKRPYLVMKRLSSYFVTQSNIGIKIQGQFVQFQRTGVKYSHGVVFV